MLAFMSAGIVALLPYTLAGIEGRVFWSTALTFLALFGLARLGHSSRRPMVESGLETLVLGAVVAMAAYGAGLIASVLASVTAEVT